MANYDSASELLFTEGVGEAAQALDSARATPPLQRITVRDNYGDAEYPDGCWVCGIEGQVPVFGDSPEEAQMRWEARAAATA